MIYILYFMNTAVISFDLLDPTCERRTPIHHSICWIRFLLYFSDCTRIQGQCHDFSTFLLKKTLPGPFMNTKKRFHEKKISRRYSQKQRVHLVVDTRISNFVIESSRKRNISRNCFRLFIWGPG